VDGVKRWHSRLPECQDGPWMYAFLARKVDHVYAVALWSSPSARCLPQHYVELRRMACAPDAPKNTASRFLAWMLRQIPASHWKAISYQDTEVHTGTIYKAAGWFPAHTVVPKARVRDRSKPRRGTNRPYRQDINGTAIAAAPKIRWEKRMSTNAERIQRAHELVLAYISETGEQSLEETLTDLLTDLKHWAKSQKVNFAKAHETADMHFEHEK
jgi:hypothetical protein